MYSKGKIFLAEDNPITAMSLQLFLSDIHFEVDTTVYGEEVPDKLRASPSDLVLMDIVLRGEVNGLEAAQELRRYSHIPILFMTTSRSPYLLRKIKTVYNSDILLKPYEYEDLEKKIHELLEGKQVPV